MRLRIIAVICLLIGGFFPIFADLPRTVSAYTSHLPILIDGNGNFTAANGVAGGIGVPSDPYVIEGWEINASAAYGIEIRNTDAHFIIRDIYAHSGGTSFDGIYLFNITNGVLENVTVSDNWNGIRLHSSNNTTVTSNNFLNNWYGTSLPSSTNVTVVGNNFSGNMNGAILFTSYNVTITGNNISSNDQSGIRLYSSTNTIITSNSISDNGDGIRLGDSSNVTITVNNLSSNKWHGVLVSSSTDITVRNNTLVSDGVNIYGQSLAHYNTHTITTDNLINGKPLYYYKDCNGSSVDGIPVGQLIVVNCTNFQAANLEITDTDIGINIAFVNDTDITGNNVSLNEWYGIYLYMAINTTVMDNEISLNTVDGMRIHSTTGLITNNEIVSNVWVGLRVGYSNNVTIAYNNVSSNEDGIGLSGSNNITVTNNTVVQNRNFGIEVSSSTNNRIYHNNFIDNANQSYDSQPNLWDGGYPSGGNYWTDYVGIDNKSGPNQDQPGGDGIGDTHYEILGGVSKDRYPLMFPLGTIYSRPPAILQATLGGKNWENVTLTWSLSPDDGMGLKTVIGYRIYRNMSYNPEGLGYSPISSLPNGTSTFTDQGAGKGDPNGYLYRVCARDVNNTTVCSTTQAGKFTRSLMKGPNLVSIPLIQSNESIEMVLQTVEFDKSWLYDSSSEKWKWYMTFKPYKGELRSINETQGFWVNVTTECNFTIAGIVPLEATILLNKGWNLVSFPSFREGYTVADFRQEVNATVRVEGFSSSSEPYRLAMLQETDTLEAGRGYWIKVGVSTLWFSSN